MSMVTALIPVLAAGLLLAAQRPVAADGDAVEYEHGPRHGGSVVATLQRPSRIPLTSPVL